MGGTVTEHQDIPGLFSCSLPLSFYVAEWEALAFKAVPSCLGAQGRTRYTQHPNLQSVLLCSPS